jgi:hypothetical protein
MIKYGVLDEYHCSQCNEIVTVPQNTSMEELVKIGSVGDCKHTWEKTEQKNSLEDDVPG